MFTRISDLERLFGSMSLLQRRLDNLYSNYGRTPGYIWEVEENGPSTNLYENGDNFEIRTEVPGLGKDDLNIKIQGNYLEIAGTRNPDVPEGYKAHKIERETGSFSRSFTLPADLDATKVEAALKDGVLYLTLPKSDAAKPRQIEIKTA
jgi:HSP20 family protein